MLWIFQARKALLQQNGTTSLNGTSCFPDQNVQHNGTNGTTKTHQNGHSNGHANGKSEYINGDIAADLTRRKVQ